MSDIVGNGCETLMPFGERLPVEEIERDIIKKYRRNIWSKFIKAVKDYEMVEEGDRIAVAVSGGKDSLIMAKLFQELQRHGKMKIELEFICADPGYHENIKELMISNCEHLRIPLKVYETNIFKVAEKIAGDYPCYMCAKMRRGALYNKTKELGCNKLALGHHFNDVIETTMLNMLYTGSYKTMLPKLHSTNFKGLELIRPLYYVEEKHIESMTQNSGICALNCACMVTAKKTGNKRYEIKDIIEDLKKKIPDADRKIFKATENINIEAVLGWVKGGKKYSYLDFYDE